MSLPEFQLLRPQQLTEALALLNELGPDAVFYMGGTELLLAMKLGLSQPSALIDGKQLAELRGVQHDGQWVRLGAGLTHLELERDPTIREIFPEFASVEHSVANIRVRAAGTIGGNLCFAEPHSDPATFLSAIGAEVELASSEGLRTLPIDDFVLGPLHTSLGPGEIMTTICLPPPEPEQKVAFQRIKLKERPAANVAVRRGQSGFCIVVGAVGARPMRMKAAEQMMEEDPNAIDAACEVIAATVEPLEDGDGSVDYKRHLASVLARLCLEEVL